MAAESTKAAAEPRVTDVSKQAAKGSKVQTVPTTRTGPKVKAKSTNSATAAAAPSVQVRAECLPARKTALLVLALPANVLNAVRHGQLSQLSEDELREVVRTIISVDGSISLKARRVPPMRVKGRT